MRRILVLAGVLAVALAGSLVWRTAVTDSDDAVVVVHWSNSHLMRDGLLPDMAEAFNDADFETDAGEPIRVEVYQYDSFAQAEDLGERVKRGVPIDAERPDPTVVTPQAEHWLLPMNDEVGRTVVDIGESLPIAQSWVGIVTYREMAECLGWPERAIGYEDIIELRRDPEGWGRHDCAQPSWGRRPLLAFTDPDTSTTGRSVLFTLYSIAAGKPPATLTASDVDDTEVREYVSGFQNLVDHYMPGTIPLNTKVHQGPEYGHFFLMPEDNLVHLYEGTEEALVDGELQQPPPIDEPMVMIYPKEGSTLHSNPAGVVDAPWVTPARHEAADAWIEYLRDDERQRAFLAAGFRPGTDLQLTEPIHASFGLDPRMPEVTIRPSELEPTVAVRIIDSWPEVKRPAIVTFVVDASGSMAAEDKLEQAKDGLLAALDGMAPNNQVGLVTFGDTVLDSVPVVPLSEGQFEIGDRIQQMRAQGDTALFDAIAHGIELTDAADGPANAIRAVVVLTDGVATSGSMELDELIEMSSEREVGIAQFSGYEASGAVDEEGGEVARDQLIGLRMLMETEHDVQVFTIAIGSDADVHVGRVLAEATDAEFRGVAEDDLANIIEEFGRYF